jgi:hypothetical protein
MSCTAISVGINRNEPRSGFARPILCILVIQMAGEKGSPG